MKKRFVMVFMFFLIMMSLLGYVLLNINVPQQIAMDEKDINLRIIPIDENVDEEKIILRSIANASYLIDMNNKETIAEQAELIIIGTVSSIEGVTNYNPVTENYVMTGTLGKISVNKVIKGSVDENEISFIRLGGIIPVSEYEKSLFPEQVEKRGFNKLTQVEKENKYVEERMDSDIKIEKDKTYLMYLSYAENYSRYSIQFLQYGLREIQTEVLNTETNILNFNKNTITSNEYNDIKVKNNQNGEFESLNNIIPEKYRK